MRDESKFLSFTEFKERYDIKQNSLAFSGVVSAIKTLNKMRSKRRSLQKKSKRIIEIFFSVSKTNGLSKPRQLETDLPWQTSKHCLKTAKLPVYMTHTHKILPI